MLFDWIKFIIFFAAQSIKCNSSVSIEQYKKAKINEINEINLFYGSKDFVKWGAPVGRLEADILSAIFNRSDKGLALKTSFSQGLEGFSWDGGLSNFDFHWTKIL